MGLSAGIAEPSRVNRLSTAGTSTIPVNLEGASWARLAMTVAAIATAARRCDRAVMRTSIAPLLSLNETDDEQPPRYAA
jgi:hypothetical protein